MAILSPNQLEKLPLSIALVGMPFTGKTQSVATLHNYYVRKKLPSTIHVLDYDRKVDSLLRVAREQGWEQDIYIHRIAQEGGERMSTLEIPNRSRLKMELMVNELNSINDYLQDPYNFKPEHRIGCIVHDSYTEIWNNLWDGILDNRGKEVGGSVGGAEHRPKRGDEGEEIEWTEWRLLREKVIEYIKVAKSFPCDNVFTFHEEVILEELRGGDPKKPTIVTTGRRLRIPIGGTRNLSASLGKYFSVMLYTAIDDTKQGKERYRWQTRATREIPAAGSVLKANLPDDVQQDFANVLD